MKNEIEHIPKKIAKRKKRILRSAIRLFKENGYYNVSIEDIVKATDSSTGTFYNYFGSKDELVISYRRELLNSCYSFYKLLQNDASNINKNSLEKLKAMILYILELLDKLGEEFGRVFTVHRLKEADAVPEDKPYYPLLIKLIEAGQKDESIRTDYPVQKLTDIIDFFILGQHIDWQIKRSRYNIADSDSSALNMLLYNISSSAAAEKHQQMHFSEIWADALSRINQNLSSDIKQIEEQWLERLYNNKQY